MKCPNCQNELELQPYLMFECPNCHKTYKGDMDIKNENLTLTEVISIPKEGWKPDNIVSSFFYYELNKTEA